MFEGKMLRELMGTPIRRIDLANSRLALAEPRAVHIGEFDDEVVGAF